MLPAPRIIAIDDDEPHLRAIAAGLNAAGSACLPLHFTGDALATRSPKHVRLVFMDLHLAGPGSEGNQNFAVIGGILDEIIKPDNGPYLMVLWTRFPEEKEGLEKYLARLDAEIRPVAILPLDKVDHITPQHELKDAVALANSIKELFSRSPQLVALLDWEHSVGAAAGATISEVLRLLDGGPRAIEQLGPALDRLLSRLAIEAVGKNNVAKDPLAAVNEALGPLLLDQLGQAEATMDRQDRWKTALTKLTGKDAITLREAARLNAMLHIAPTGKSLPCDRGVVLELPADWQAEKKFREMWGARPATVLQSEFKLPANPGGRWVLLQVQAECDYAQSRMGPLPYLLCLELPAAVELPENATQAIHRTPPFLLGKQEKYLAVHMRFRTGFSRDMVKALPVLYRIRPQLLALLTGELGAHSTRLGIISFRPVEVTTPSDAPASTGEAVAPPSDKAVG